MRRHSFVNLLPRNQEASPPQSAQSSKQFAAGTSTSIHVPPSSNHGRRSLSLTSHRQFADWLRPSSARLGSTRSWRQTSDVKRKGRSWGIWSARRSICRYGRVALRHSSILYCVPWSSPRRMHFVDIGPAELLRTYTRFSRYSLCFVR